MIDIRHGDCLGLMKDIPDGSVDMILADLPYGTTDCKWDTVIPLDGLWEHFHRIVKKNAAIVLFSQQPFSSTLIESNKKEFRYEWIWDKRSPLGFLNANRMPLRVHENILIFYKKLPTYNPQMRSGKPYNKGIRPANRCACYGAFGSNYGNNETGERFPTDILQFSNANRLNRYHPTQKPVPLLEYLIKTYTNPGETVLDPVMGSGSTGVACLNTGRKFIGIEKDDTYYETARKRLIEAANKIA